MNCKFFCNFFRDLFSSLVYVIIKTLTIFILIQGLVNLSQFRELVIESACRLKLRNKSVVIETVAGNQELALEQINWKTNNKAKNKLSASTKRMIVI